MRPESTKAVVISPEELDAGLRDGANVVVLEVDRWAEDGSAEEDTYATGHIPGSRLVRFERDLVGRRTGTSGNSPLPGPAELEARLRAWDIHDDSRVVVCTRRAPAAATRAWWILRWAGVEDVAYLDGGLRAWRRAGGALDTEVPPPGAGTARVRPDSLPVLTADEALRLAADGHLVDARAASAYPGDPARPGTGHIPGAHSVPGPDNFDDGELLDAGALSGLYAAHLDGRAIGAYCGSGVSATSTVLALAHLGVEAALYPGSWSAWTTDPARPVATGERPGTVPAPTK